MDLPGIGTPTFPDLEIYCEKVKLETYDAYLILTAGRFTKLEFELAQKVKSMDKPLFLVRTKIDQDEANDKRKKKHNIESMLQRIRVYCHGSVKDLGIPLNDIFIISNHESEKWEFECLVEAILDGLPDVQKNALTLSLRILSKDFVKRKVKVLRGWL